jgi:hypothetical protein
VKLVPYVKFALELMDLEVSDRQLSIIVEPEEPVSGIPDCT